ncbi:MAG: SsrA-binding protein SmpB [Firmicutes bacterium]|nr:SsrA-binding protein SmpB [Bacillota bacterium]
MKVKLMEINNRKAYHDYFVLETVEAGIVLTGTEIKSIRENGANIKDSYAIIKNNEAFLLNAHISHYENAGVFNHNENRTRKLLLNKKEILKLKEKITLNGYTLVPLKMYFNRGILKVSLGICRGKKNYDKRESIKERDIKREISRDFKNNY